MDTDDPPIHHVTVDQIVALNIRYFRKAAGMTQEELGELVGWTAPNISAAEASAKEGKDRRRFDAQTSVTFARALGVPLLALFLPPVDEGGERRYVFSAGDGSPGEWLDMQELMRVAYPDSDDDTLVMTSYRTWLSIAVTRFMDPKWAKALAAWLGKREPRDVLAGRLRRLRSVQFALSDGGNDVRELADALAEELGAEDDS